MHSGCWEEDHHLHNGLFCAYYVLGLGPGIQEMVKLITEAVHLYFLLLSTLTAIISLVFGTIL